MKRNFFRKNYRESFNFIFKSRKFIYSIICIFVLFSIIGFFIHVPEIVSSFILEFIDELLDKTKNMSFIDLTLFIFLNNLKSSFLGMIYGIFLGIFPFIISLFNGYLLGFVANRVVQKEGIFILWRILPHGIFELPALFISLGLGAKIGSFVFQKNKLQSFKIYFVMSLKVFFFIVIPLLIIAALIEGFLIFFF